MRPLQLAAERDHERIVGRLSLEPTVSAARWQAEVNLESEGPALAINTGSRAATGATP